MTSKTTRFDDGLDGCASIGEDGVCGVHEHGSETPLAELKTLVAGSEHAYRIGVNVAPPQAGGKVAGIKEVYDTLRSEANKNRKVDPFGFDWPGRAFSCQHDSDRKCSCVEGTGYDDIDQFLRECLDTMRVKGHDYREGNDDDLLHNFRTTGEDVDIPMEKIWYIYCSKHWKAIKTFIKEGGQSESEPIEGRIKDVIVYMLLLYRMTQKLKAEKATTEG